MPTVVEPPTVLAMGLSHHTAPVSVREKLAFDADTVREELRYLREARLAREALLLSTCNRVELYAVPFPGASDRLLTRLASHQGLGGQRVEGLLYCHRDRAAVRHLFRVASSLDSLVVGEPQILGQVKSAVKLAQGCRSLGAVLQRLAQQSLRVAKQVRTHTAIGHSTVGVGNAGVLLAEQIFSSLQGRRALLIGTGEMGRQVARAMLGKGLAELLVANRTFQRAVDLATAFDATPLHWERVAEYLPRVDIVITATGATRPILDVATVRRALRARRYEPLFLVDLAVPRNIEPEVDALDEAWLFNVDDLTRVMERGRGERASASVEAERLVDAETDAFVARLAELDVHDAIGRVSRHVDAVREAELQRSRRLLATLDDDQRAQLEALLRGFSKKVMHPVVSGAREAMADGDPGRAATLLAPWDLGD